MQTTNPARQFSGEHWARRAIAALVAIAACFSFASGIRADQTPEEITSLLTTGTWRFHNMAIARHFNADGTFTASNNSEGTWRIAGGQLVILFPKDQPHIFFLPINPDGTSGTYKGKPDFLLRDAPGVSKNAHRRGDAGNQESWTTAPTPPISAEVQQAASQIIQAHSTSLVFVTGSDAAGSGFIAQMNGGNFLVTNAHVAAGIRDAAFKTLDGTAVQSDVASVAVGEDIFCMAMAAGGKPFEIMQKVDENAAVGDDVVVLGNAEGGGVINTIIGKIVGIGPNLVEVDAPFVPGNSGSPIIHLKSGKVIGVATYLVTNQYDLTTNQKLKQPVVRRFGYRLDSVKGWQPVNWRAFYAQAAEMDQIEGLTNDLYDFFRDLDENKGVVTLARHTNPVIKDRIDEWLEQKGNHPSAEDAAEADASFLSYLKLACQSDINAAQSQITYDYFRRDLADQKHTRDDMAKAFQEIIQVVGQ